MTGELPTRPQPSLTDRVLKWFWFLGVPILCVYFIATLVTPAKDAFAAHQGHGVHGTFVATREQCDRGCDWYGDFTSNDGTIVRRDIFIQDSGGYEVGQHVPALYEPASGEVYAASGGPDWVIVPLLMGLAIAGLCAWAVSLFLAVRRRRGRRSATRRYLGLDR